MKPLKDKNPLVSVIIPNYNHAKYLDERIQSVLNQTYQNFEVIILDDVSTDNSRDVIEKYRNEPHVSKIVYNEQNSGSTFKQWLKGMALAKGDLIWIAESDDSCEKEMLEKLVEEFSKDENLVLAFCNSMIIDENDTEKFIARPTKWQITIRESGEKFIRNCLYLENIIYNASSALFKKEVALGIDRQYTQYKGSGDWLFWIEICEQGNISMLKEPLNKFRKHFGNVTTQLMCNGVQQIENKYILEYLVVNKLISKYSKEKLRLHNLYMYEYKTPFQNEETKDNAIRVWEPTKIEKLYISVLYFLKKLKHKAKMVLKGQEI